MILFSRGKAKEMSEWRKSNLTSLVIEKEKRHSVG
jgi:hypothetical protein